MDLRPFPAILLCLASWLLFAAAVSADTWLPPTVKTVQSASGHHRFTVEPGVPAGADARPPSGRLERRLPDGRWQQVWERTLVNPVMPVDWRVADSGAHVVTWDNWFRAGGGPNVLVVYGPEGRLVATLALDQIVPADMVPTLPRSVSSIWWAGPHGFTDDGSRMLLRIVRPGAYRMPADRSYFTLELDPATGRIEPVRDWQWWAALAEMRRLRRQQAAADERFARPARTPRIDSWREWRTYARDLFFRIDPDWKKKRPEVTVLRLPPDAGAVTELRWIRGNLASAPAGSPLVFVSPAPGVLAEALVHAALYLPRNSLQGRRVYAVLPAGEAGPVRLALGRLGAEVIVIAPDQAVPQRPERLKPTNPEIAGISR